MKSRRIKSNIFHLLVSVLLLSSTTLFAQGINCREAEPFCADAVGAFFFENSWTPPNVPPPQAEPGPNYGCLSSTPNPAWFFLQIDQDGDLYNKPCKTTCTQSPTETHDNI